MGQQRQRGSKHGYPGSAHIVRDYATLKNIAQAFAAGQIKLLILLGGPGPGQLHPAARGKSCASMRHLTCKPLAPVTAFPTMYKPETSPAYVRGV